MSDDMTGSADKPVEETGAQRYQFGMRVLFLFPAAIALPFAAAYLSDSAAWGALVLLAELTAGVVYRPTRPLAIPVLVLLVLVVLFLPSRSAARAAARSSQCKNQMKMILLALHNYHDFYGCFPPAYVANEDGQPVHSWRVLILPFLEQQPLYEQYRFDEPWDGPNNSKLADKIPYTLRCPSEPNPSSDCTNYLLVAGDGTAWSGDGAPRFSDFTDGPSSTIILVEIASSGIHWMEPRDPTLEQAIRGINSGSRTGISSWHPKRGDRERQESAHVALADGSVVNLKNDFPEKELKKLLTYQGGETVAPPQ